MTARSTDDQAIMGIQQPADLWLTYHPGTPDGLSSIRNFVEKVVSEETRIEELSKN